MNPEQRIQVKQGVFDELLRAGKLNPGGTYNDNNKVIFRHPRHLRLSKLGYTLLKSIKKPYCFEVDLNKIKTQHLVNLASKARYTYFFENNKIYLFDEKDAMMCKLHGDILNWLS